MANQRGIVNSSPRGADRLEFPSVSEVAAQLDHVSKKLRSDERPMAAALVDAAVEMSGATWGTITIREDNRYRSLVVSDERALELDLLQYAVGSGPCLDAIEHDSTYMVSELFEETRWPEYAAGASSLGVRSIYSQPLHLLDDDFSVASLNLYSDMPAAFDERAETGEAAVVATFAALGSSIVLSKTKADHLEKALLTNREIAMAIGILMGRHTLSHDAALNLMRLASQHTNKKMIAIAQEVITTGELALQRPEHSR